MQPLTYSVPKGLRAGAVGGFLGAVVLGVTAEIGAVSMNQELFYTTIAKKLGFGDSSLLGGWVLHFLVGIIAGALFIGVTAAIRAFILTTMKRAIWVGILGGIAVWIVVYVPVTAVLVPDDLTNTSFAVGTLILHIPFGVVTTVVSLLLFRRKIMTKPAA